MFVVIFYALSKNHEASLTIAGVGFSLATLGTLGQLANYIAGIPPYAPPPHQLGEEPGELVEKSVSKRKGRER